MKIKKKKKSELSLEKYNYAHGEDGDEFFED